MDRDFTNKYFQEMFSEGEDSASAILYEPRISANSQLI